MIINNRPKSSTRIFETLTYGGVMFMKCSSVVYLVVLRSQWLLQMLISDDADTAHSALNLIQYAVRVNSDVVSSLDEKVLHALLDEMVFKIVSGVDKYVAK